MSLSTTYQLVQLDATTLPLLLFYQSHYSVHFVTNFRPTLNAPYLQLLISNKNNVPPKMN